MPTDSLGIKVDAGFGRLYVSGPRARSVMGLPGAALNPRRNSVELSLTLDTLRAIKSKLACDSRTLAACCTVPVMAWAKAAGRSEQQVSDMHRRLESGWRAQLPWWDNVGTAKPFAHQEIMASVALTIDGSAFLCDMGTGKTRAALEALSERVRRGELQYTVVACPSRVRGVWREQIARWTRNLKCVMLEGSVKERARIIERLGEMPPVDGEGVVFVVNYEVLYLLVTQFAGVMQAHAVGLILDECHKCKNPQAKVTKAALELSRHASWRLLMSGTPITGKYQDVWPQWYCVDLGITFGANFAQFKREFFIENSYTFEIVPRRGTAEIIRDRIARRALRFTKAECMDLPPKMYTTVSIEMTREQKRAYDEMAALLIARLGELPGDGDDSDETSVATASTQLTQILRLAQITSGFVKNSEGAIHRFTPNPKLDACDDLVRDEIESGKSVIVWAWYKEDVARLLERFHNLAPVCIRAGQTIDEHAAVEQAFQSGRAKLLISNQATGGTGITLTAASVAVYYSQSYSMTDRIQSEDRSHRAGSEIHDKITYVDLCCTGTIDEMVRGAIDRKLSMLAAVIEFRKHLEECAD